MLGFRARSPRPELMGLLLPLSRKYVAWNNNKLRSQIALLLGGRDDIKLDLRANNALLGDDCDYNCGPGSWAPTARCV